MNDDKMNQSSSDEKLCCHLIVLCRKSNRRTEGRVDGSEEGEGGDKVRMKIKIRIR